MLDAPQVTRNRSVKAHLDSFQQMIHAPCHTGGENLANLIWWKIPSWPQSGSPFDAQPSIQEKGFLWLSQDIRLSRTVCDPSVTFQKTGRGSGGKSQWFCFPFMVYATKAPWGLFSFNLVPMLTAHELSSATLTCWPVAAQSLHTDEGAHHK